MGSLLTATFDFGPFKSEFNGKHDLPGSKFCPLCSTKYRYGHLLVHSEWKNPLLIGPEYAEMLSDADPDWLEKKLKREVGGLLRSDGRKPKTLQRRSDSDSGRRRRVKRDTTVSGVRKRHDLRTSNRCLRTSLCVNSGRLPTVKPVNSRGWQSDARLKRNRQPLTQRPS